MAAALKQRGFIEAQSPESAAIVLFVSYGIGSPTQQSYTYLTPQIGLVPKTTTVNGTISTTGNTSAITGTAATQSKLGITGLASATGTYTTYTRYLLVTAVDLEHYKLTKEAREVWKTAVVSTGSSNDFRLVLPYLIVAGSQYFGEMTDHTIDQDIVEGDARVLALKHLARPNSK
ncbi:MAG TPA: hypothetical protein VF105_02990 [Gemmatimonadaceae bacterium]